MQFSIILPTFNEGRQLAQTVASILRHSKGHQVEVIVVDDHSDDFSGSQLADDYRSEPSVKVIRNQVRRGAGGSRDVGAEIAAGDVLIFLDAHSRVPDDWLKTFESSANVCGAAASTTLFGTTLRPLNDGMYAAEGNDARSAVFREANMVAKYDRWRDTPNPYPCMLLTGGIMILDRGFFESLGGFDDGLQPPWGQEPEELCFRVWSQGYEVRMIPNLIIETLYKTEVSCTGIRAAKTTANRLRIAALYFEKMRFEQVIEAIKPEKVFSQALWLLAGSDYQTRRQSLQCTVTADDIFDKFGVYWD